MSCLSWKVSLKAPKRQPQARQRRGDYKSNSGQKKTAAEIAEEDADESEKVELVLTLPLDRREAYSKRVSRYTSQVEVKRARE